MSEGIHAGSGLRDNEEAIYEAAEARATARPLPVVNGCQMHSFIGYVRPDVGRCDGVGVFILCDKVTPSRGEVMTAHYELGASFWHGGNYIQYGPTERLKTLADALAAGVSDAAKRAGYSV
jgi:hypothetical protein